MDGDKSTTDKDEVLPFKLRRPVLMGAPTCDLLIRRPGCFRNRLRRAVVSVMKLACELSDMSEISHKQGAQKSATRRSSATLEGTWQDT